MLALVPWNLLVLFTVFLLLPKILLVVVLLLFVGLVTVLLQSCESPFLSALNNFKIISKDTFIITFSLSLFLLAFVFGFLLLLLFLLLGLLRVVLRVWGDLIIAYNEVVAALVASMRWMGRVFRVVVAVFVLFWFLIWGLCHTLIFRKLLSNSIFIHTSIIVFKFWMAQIYFWEAQNIDFLAFFELIEYFNRFFMTICWYLLHLDPSSIIIHSWNINRSE